MMMTFSENTFSMTFYMYRVRQKSIPIKFLSLFSQQLFGILVWNFTALFMKTSTS